MTYVEFDGVLVPLALRMQACGCWHNLRTRKAHQCAEHNTWRQVTLDVQGTTPLVVHRWSQVAKRELLGA